MARGTAALTETFNRFFESEKAGGALLLLATLLSIVLANAAVGPAYIEFWQLRAQGLGVEHWINDALMAVFFLLIGLELERELYVGELSDPRKALLPLIAALGGMIAPALIHFALNAGAPSQGGFGIPMATDIAFVLGVLALLGDRVPAALKVFAVAFAVVDDLGAIVVIALFYTADLSFAFLALALGVWGVLIAFNRMRVMALWPYLTGGLAMWFCLLHSGLHATLAGVMLAFAIPFTARAEDRKSPSHRLEHRLHRPVAFCILPLFALANTCIVLGPGWAGELAGHNALGIAAGLLIGKPAGVGILGGIGFTMSIFIANLAFPTSPEVVNASKIAILLSSLTAGLSGFLWLLRR